MLIRPSLRRSTISRLSKSLAIFVLLWTLFDTISVQRAISKEASRESRPLGHERVFIASLHWTDEKVLRSHWISAVLDVAQALGRNNVFVSVYESGSLDDTKGALRELHSELAKAEIPGRVLLDETTRNDVTNEEPAETGWIQMPKDKWYMQM